MEAPDKEKLRAGTIFTNGTEDCQTETEVLPFQEAEIVLPNVPAPETEVVLPVVPVFPNDENRAYHVITDFETEVHKEGPLNTKTENQYQLPT